MKHVEYVPQGVCSRHISFDITDEGNISNLVFQGGCNGNLKAIGRLLEGQNAKRAAEILKGNTCGMKQTSCGDQLARAILENL